MPALILICVLQSTIIWSILWSEARQAELLPACFHMLACLSVYLPVSLSVCLPVYLAHSPRGSIVTCDTRSSMRRMTSSYAESRKVPVLVRTLLRSAFPVAVLTT